MCWTVKGCCCCNLRTAGLIHGWAGIAILLLAISFTINRMLNFDHFAADEIAIDADMTIHSFNIRQRTLNQEFYSLVVYFFDVIISGLLIAGVTKNTHYFLLPWMILRAIALVIAVPFGLLFLFFSAFLKPGIFVVALLYSLIIGLFTWSWIVIYSLYEEIRNSRKRPLMPMTVQMPMPSALPPYYESQSGPLGPAPPYQMFDKQST